MGEEGKDKDMSKDEDRDKDKPKEGGKPKEKEKKKMAKTSASIFVNELRTRLETYFKIVIRNVRDSVPRVIGYFLVRSLQNRMQLELFRRLGEMREAVERGLGEVRLSTRHVAT